MTFLGLMALLLLTIGMNYVPLPSWLHPVANFTIAVAKALLVLIYFMQLRYSGKLTLVFAVAGFYWFLILLALTMSDYVTRGYLPFPGH
ncbi:MAG TPA: caa(3)-type oxidase subunit IV [Deltaproteobacteria bacterium]|nr:caa(3)-type oxidase subunit IV [Deltaproteobacteria bacterium]